MHASLCEPQVGGPLLSDAHHRLYLLCVEGRHELGRHCQGPLANGVAEMLEQVNHCGKGGEEGGGGG